MARPGPDPDRVAQAWELHVQGYSLRQIGEHLGISHESARTWIERHREAVRYVDLMDHAEERMRAAERLNQWATLLLDEYKAGGGKAIEYVRELRALQRERARLLGTDAPTRVAVDHGEPPVTVDPETVAAVRAARQRAEADERHLLENGHRSP